jgi:hypothetical protein
MEIRKVDTSLKKVNFIYKCGYYLKLIIFVHSNQIGKYFLAKNCPNFCNKNLFKKLFCQNG